MEFHGNSMDILSSSVSDISVLIIYFFSMWLGVRGAFHSLSREYNSVYADCIPLN